MRDTDIDRLAEWYKTQAYKIMSKEYVPAGLLQSIEKVTASLLYFAENVDDIDRQETVLTAIMQARRKAQNTRLMHIDPVLRGAGNHVRDRINESRREDGGE